MQNDSFSFRLTAVIAILVLFGAVSQAATERVIHNFDGSDGNAPWSTLISDAAGNFYGTADWGGVYSKGTAFELMPRAGGGWTEKVLHNFGLYPTDATFPMPDHLTFDAAGNLYGTSYGGGTLGYGAVFELMPNGSGGWTEKVIHDFPFNTGVTSAVTFDNAGNLYGSIPGGILFKLTPNESGTWTYETVHTFVGDVGSLMRNPAGNLYGVAGGGGSYGHGIVFELIPNGSGGLTVKTLHNFGCGNDGGYPTGSLTLDAAGNLYGATCLCGRYGMGTVFEATPDGYGGWTEKVLHNFDWFGAGGLGPNGGLLIDAAGNMYGTTSGGGVYSHGVLYKLTRGQNGTWSETVVHLFAMRACFIGRTASWAPQTSSVGMPRVR